MDQVIFWRYEMINNLKKRFTMIFMSSIMGIFTFVFCAFLWKNIQAHQKQEADFMERMATSLVFQLENSSNLEQDLTFAERTYDFLLYLTEQNHVLFQSSTASESDIKPFIESFENKQKQVLTVYQTDSEISQSSLNGILSFFAPDKKTYYGIQADIVTKKGQNLALYIIKKATPSFDFFKEQLLFYIGAWLSVFLLVLILSKYLISKALKPTAKTLQSQKEFVAAASHELKAPLAVILASAECIVEDAMLSDEAKKHSEIIDSECLRMSKLVQDLLLLSSLDANTWTLNKSEIDIDTLLINIYEKYEPLCRQKEIRLKLDIADEILPALNADFDRINQILGIFIDNAINYSFPKSEICLNASVSNKQVIFSIIDHGIGIKESEKPYIYDRFFCADKSRTQKEHYGLGLSIAQELVTMHDGKIILTDTPGGGCTFKIFMP